MIMFMQFINLTSVLLGVILDIIYYMNNMQYMLWLYTYIYIFNL